MELYIATLTGTVFELRVSPLDTVMTIKAKIQRLEGIPSSQQHLIWKSEELADDCTLEDYKIMSGATLKLVIAMRGGPINTRRVSVEDSTWKEITDYMEANREDIWEKLPGGQQVTLLVFRDGDQVNFFRLVDGGDGTVAPLAETRSMSSVRNVCITEELHSVDQRLKENNVTMHKMRSIRKQMEALTLKKKQPRKRVVCSRLSASVTAVPGKSKTPRSSHLLRLPPVPGCRAPLPSHAVASSALQLKQSRKPSATSESCVRPKCSSHIIAQHDKSTGHRHRASEAAPEEETSPLVQLSVQSRGFRRVSDIGTVSQLHGDRVLRVQTNYNNTSDNDELEPRWSPTSWPSSRENLSHSENRSGSAAARDGSVTVGVMSPASDLSTRAYLRSNCKHHPGSHSSMENLEQLQQTLAKFDPRISVQASPRSRLSRNPSNGTNVYSMDLLVRRMVLENNCTVPERERGSRPKTSPSNPVGRCLNSIDGTLKPKRPPQVNAPNSLVAVRTRSNSKFSVDEKDALPSAAIQSKQSRISPDMGKRYCQKEDKEAVACGVSSFLRVLPPEETSSFGESTVGKVENLISEKARSCISLPSVILTKKKHPRCQVCNRKTGLATSYSCRCNGNFCATHRYAETHDCTFDYKAEGRKILDQHNPLVTAEKLPKI